MMELEVYAVVMFDRGGPSRVIRYIVATSWDLARTLAQWWPGVVESVEYDRAVYIEEAR